MSFPVDRVLSKAGSAVIADRRALTAKSTVFWGDPSLSRQTQATPAALSAVQHQSPPMRSPSRHDARGSRSRRRSKHRLAPSLEDRTSNASPRPIKFHSLPFRQRAMTFGSLTMERTMTLPLHELVVSIPAIRSIVRPIWFVQSRLVSQDNRLVKSYLFSIALDERTPNRLTRSVLPYREFYSPEEGAK